MSIPPLPLSLSNIHPDCQGDVAWRDRDRRNAQALGLGPVPNPCPGTKPPAPTTTSASATAAQIDSGFAAAGVAAPHGEQAVTTSADDTACVTALGAEAAT
jgi:hypothetical protein